MQATPGDTAPAAWAILFGRAQAKNDLESYIYNMRDRCSEHNIAAVAADCVHHVAVRLSGRGLVEKTAKCGR